MMISPLLAAALVLQAAPATDPQGVEYRIEARLDEETHILHGRARLRYTNNSSVALDTLWFHQHLNAFRPNSAWARRELEFGERRFTDLGPDDHAFDRFVQVRIAGREVRPVYPLSPDSTVAGLPLPSALVPGDSTVVEFDWVARLSTLPRRQGRAGRHYDFAQWYPRIAVFTEDGWQVQPLLPQGEFFGEFATYDVTLEVAEDQVIGATGVPVEGDPGWATAAAQAGEPAYQRDHYGDPAAVSLGFLDAAPGAGRKRIRWRAEDVHHFAWSADPEFVHEGGQVPRTGPEGGTIAVHVLHTPSAQGWGNGVALQRTMRALEWLQGMFGPYPWPQLTNLQRIESGGTEFPMVTMNGSPSEGLIVHEVTHQYLHGILANNEFAEGWLDEGFTSFITNWYLEERGETGVWDESMAIIIQFDRLGRTEPIALPAADFRDPSSYSLMTYAKAELMFRMLRWLIGEEPMREALRLYYERHALSHVDEDDLRRAVSDAAGEDLGWFFDQWLHTIDRLDYAVAAVDTEQRGDGSWVTTVEIARNGDAWMPVTLRVGEEEQRLESRETRQTVEVITSTRPNEVVLDPEGVLIDVDPTNNRMAVSAP